MNYIVLDLEWNQTYMEKALAVQKQLSIRLRGEVIQIGAVKLNEDLDIIGSYRITVKPRFFKKIHRHVMRLTGIDQAQLDHGVPLAEAMTSFRRFCGEDSAFLTWGPDDLPMLEDNLRANKLEGGLVDRAYDMQPMFNRETDGEKRQRSLEYAMEYFGIEMNLPAHDALNDAYFTALVAQKLHIAEGIRLAAEEKGEYLYDVTLGDADSGEVGFSSPEEVLRREEITSPVCPVCGKPFAESEKMLHSKGQKYTVHHRCETDGDLLLQVRLYRNINETFRARIIIFPATEEKLQNYHDKLALEQEFHRSHRRHRSHKPANADTAPIGAGTAE